MEIINLNTFNSILKIENLIIGHFNVIHNGHIKLFKNLNNFSFLIFQNNPSKNYNIFNLDERIGNLKTFNPEYIIVYNIIEDNCDADIFIKKYLLKHIQVNKIYVGSDYRFGKNQSGDVTTLQKYFDIKIIVNDRLISTSQIKQLIENGKVDQANKLMPIPFYYSGIVVKGKGIASKSFFPTANIIENKNINIRHGSYISTTIINGKEYESITFIGIPKSIESVHNFVETYIFNFNEDIYGKFLKVNIIKFIRDNQKFNNFNELIKNINNDLNIAKTYFKERGKNAEYSDK